MSAYLRRYSSLFRTRPQPDPEPIAAVAEDLASSKQVIEVRDDADGFASVTVRPMTYAEAARGDAPLKPAITTEDSPFAVVDEAQWAVNAVQAYISECESQALPHAGTHVATNQEYLDHADSAENRYLHSKRGRRNSKRRGRATATARGSSAGNATTRRSQASQALPARQTPHSSHRF